METNCEEFKDINTCESHKPTCLWRYNPPRCVNSNSVIKIESLRKKPPPRGSTIIRPSSTRFVTNPEEDIKVQIPVFKQADISKIRTVQPEISIAKPTLGISSIKPEQENKSTIPIIKTVSKMEPLPVTKPLIFSEVVDSKPIDECEQLNFFQNKQASCYLDSLVFGLVHIQNNKFIDELKTMTNESETCKNRIIKYLINMHTQIHSRSVPVKRILIDDFRNLLYDCEKDKKKFNERFYKNEQQDVNEFLNTILTLIEPNENYYRNVREFQGPEGHVKLLETFPIYLPEPRNEKSYNTHIIYPQANSTDNIDLGFNQIIDESGNNIFQFSLPAENITFNMADSDYPFVVDYIFKNNLINESILGNIKEIYPNFFQQDITSVQRAEIYKEIYSLFKDSLPKLTYTKIKNANIYFNPINYFIISIVREQKGKGRNNYKLINVPDRIQSYDKTLELVSAVVHYGHSSSGGHYICYFKCGANWYIMDDLRQSIQKYKPFDITDTEIMTNCRLLIYM